MNISHFYIIIIANISIHFIGLMVLARYVKQWKKKLGIIEKALEAEGR